MSTDRGGGCGGDGGGGGGGARGEPIGLGFSHLETTRVHCGAGGDAQATQVLLMNILGFGSALDPTHSRFFTRK